MKKRPVSAIVLTNENAAANLIDDTVNRQWWIVQTAAGGERILGPIPYGKCKGYVATDPTREIVNTVLVGGATAETIVAGKRYRIDIWNPESDYESQPQSPKTFGYTAPAVLSGNAVTDRTNVYTALVDKINAYGGTNATAYGLTLAAYTLGASVGDAAANFVVGEVVTQETSGLTAQVAACTITSGTFAGDNAAGIVYLYNLSAYTGWLTAAKTLSAAGTAVATDLTPATTNCVITVTNATTFHFQGIVIADKPGYFTSNKSRGGINQARLTAGFTTATASVLQAGAYPIGIGSEMSANRPLFDITGQDLTHGRLEYDFEGGSVASPTATYERIVFDVVDGDEEALSTDKVYSVKQYILYFNNASHADHTHDLLTALDTVIAKG